MKASMTSSGRRPRTPMEYPFAAAQARIWAGGAATTGLAVAAGLPEGVSANTRGRGVERVVAGCTEVG